MKIVVLNGSPRKGGNTEIMTQAFTKGAEKKGHEVVNLPVGTMKIRGCMACEYCFSHNGECAQKDDMTQVYAELKDGCICISDLLVRYHCTVKSSHRSFVCGGNSRISFS